MKKILLSALMIGAIAVACKKSDDASTPGYVAKWTAKNLITARKSNSYKNDTTTFLAGSYVDITGDKTYTVFKIKSGTDTITVMDTSSYTVSGNYFISVTGNVKDSSAYTLSGNNLTFYSVEPNSGDTTKSWTNLTK